MKTRKDENITSDEVIEVMEADEEDVIESIYTSNVNDKKSKWLSVFATVLSVAATYMLCIGMAVYVVPITVYTLIGSQGMTDDASLMDIVITWGSTSLFAILLLTALTVNVCKRSHKFFVNLVFNVYDKLQIILIKARTR